MNGMAKHTPTPARKSYLRDRAAAWASHARVDAAELHQNSVTNFASDGLALHVLCLVVPDDGATIGGLLTADATPPHPVHAFFDLDELPVWKVREK